VASTAGEERESTAFGGVEGGRGLAESDVAGALVVTCQLLWRLRAYYGNPRGKPWRKQWRRMRLTSSTSAELIAVAGDTCKAFSGDVAGCVDLGVVAYVACAWRERVSWSIL
jgi:hypothetical protein